jgi:hypothetical protein
MNAKSFCGLLACLILPFAAGCTSTDIVRGQSPEPAAQPAAYELGEDGMLYYGDAEDCPPGHWGKHMGAKHKNYLSYEYRVPKNLSYPPGEVPAGVVQYPYYTIKGPSDFFMQHSME